jgi:tetratricopeptide (TPR) repeat protein
MGWVHAQLGDYERTLETCQRAVVTLQELGDLHGEAGTWDSIAYAHHHLHDYAEAVVCYERALALFRQLGDRTTEARVLLHLGDTQYADGHAERAHETWYLARDLFEELRLPVDEVQSRLGEPSPGSSAYAVP